MHLSFAGTISAISVLQADLYCEKADVKQRLDMTFGGGGSTLGLCSWTLKQEQSVSSY